MAKDIIRWADAAMYEAQPILREEGARVTPRVFLLSATPDPTGCMAVDMRMYRGDPVYDLSEITDEERRWAWGELMKTHLNTPLEGINMKFMIEAVTRSFTHQMVRQRVGAYYVQESLRFAVKRGLAQETALPPSIFDTEEGPGKIWADTVSVIERAYDALVDAGIPAEDARGLLPHAVTTRILYNTNLRALFEHAGNRLCTQAQFEWRAVFLGIMQAMREYEGTYGFGGRGISDNWQWRMIATPNKMTFAPICYRTGKCEFMSNLDRGCTIRERVNEGRFHQIQPDEWMANPWAGITTEDNRPQ